LPALRELYEGRAQTEDDAPRQDAVSHEGEKEEEPPDAAPYDTGIKPLSGERRGYPHSERRVDAEISEGPDGEAIHKATEAACCKDHADILREVTHSSLL
jgi:hypothetical protein